MTELVFILDRSGSMQGLESDTIGGFNAMLEKQKKAEGTVLLSTILFNQESVVLHDRVNVLDVPALTGKDYEVSGCTALFDAVGGAVRHVGNVHRYIRPEDVPDHVLFVITTDGMENASRRFSESDVKRMIAEAREKGRECLFLGANIDAVATARGFGLSEENAVDFVNDGKGIHTVYESLAGVCSLFAAWGVIVGVWKRNIQKDHAQRSRTRDGVSSDPLLEALFRTVYGRFGKRF